jgi:hypothetical protein
VAQRSTRALLLLGTLVAIGAGLPFGSRAGARLAQAEGEAKPLEGKALDAFFKGQVVALKDKTLTLRYDFSKKEQLDDWKPGVPWPIAQEKDESVGWFDDRLEIKGSTGARHVAEWTGDVWVTASLTLDADKDLGGYLNPADEGDSYATFTLGEAYFHAWDGKAPGQHSIIKFGKQYRVAGASKDFIGFRYVTGRPPPTPIKAGDVVAFAFGIEKGKLGLDAGDLELRGNDMPKKFKECRPGFYTIKGRMLVDNVTITGRLSDEWVTAEKLALRTEKPLADPSSGVLDSASQALVAGYAAGTTPAADLVKVVGDPGALKPAREALAEALSAGPRKALKDVLDLLYRPEVESRTYGAGIVKRLLGKDYGFQPKASEEQRSEAIRRLNEDIKKHPDLLTGP